MKHCGKNGGWDSCPLYEKVSTNPKQFRRVIKSIIVHLHLPSNFSILIRSDFGPRSPIFDNLKSEMLTDAMKPYETTNIYIASPPSERELLLAVRKHLANGGFRVRTMHESEIAYRAAYPNCDYLREMFEGKF